MSSTTSAIVDLTEDTNNNTTTNNNTITSHPSNPIDMTEHFNELFPAGKKYKTLESLRKDVSDYGKKYNIVMSIKNSNYRSIHLWCKHGGHYRKGKKKLVDEETGKEVETVRLRQKRTQRSGCLCFIKARYLRGLWVIDTSFGEHNHAVPTNRNAYSIHRKQPRETTALIKRFLNDGQRVSDIMAHLSSIGVTNIIKKDVENMQQQLRRKKKRLEEASTIVTLPIEIRTPTPEQTEPLPVLSTVQIRNILDDQARNMAQSQIDELQQRLLDQIEEEQQQPMVIDLEEEETSTQNEELQTDKSEQRNDESQEQYHQSEEQQEQPMIIDLEEEENQSISKHRPGESKVVSSEELQEQLHDQLEEQEQQQQQEQSMIIDFEEESISKREPEESTNISTEELQEQLHGQLEEQEQQGQSMAINLEEDQHILKHKPEESKVVNSELKQEELQKQLHDQLEEQQEQQSTMLDLEEETRTITKKEPVELKAAQIEQKLTVSD